MGRYSFTVDNNFYCVFCGNKGISVPRRRGKERAAGHLKKMYCLYCGKEVNFAECKPFTSYDKHNFLEEYYGKNFDETGSRILPYTQFKTKLIKENKWNNLQKEIEEKE